MSDDHDDDSYTPDDDPHRIVARLLEARAGGLTYEELLNSVPSEFDGHLDLTLENLIEVNGLVAERDGKFVLINRIGVFNLYG